MTPDASTAAPEHSDRFVETMVYAREDDEFHTRLCLYNYFSEIFPDVETGATVLLTVYDCQGERVAQRQLAVPYRGQLQFDLAELGIAFEGRAGVAMVPETMPPVTHNLAMATGYYVFYYDDNANADFGHEWAPVSRRPLAKKSHTQIVRLREFPDSEVIAMNSYFGDEAEAGRSEWTLRLRSQQGEVLAECRMPSIPARGTARAMLREVFPHAADLAAKTSALAVEVEGTNVMGPLTCVRVPDGDFNIHHF